uniref:Uncharacterized protein n=1 Tax=Rhizophora mucronata TaxID=61149 RepID=A0A2P2NXK8_RHIMU
MIMDLVHGTPVILLKRHSGRILCGTSNYVSKV